MADLLLISAQTVCFSIGFLFRSLKKVILIGIAFVFSLVGAIIGTITGALTGQTTETGFFRGAGIGAVAGALVGIEMLELLTLGESFSKIAIFESLINGKVFREWVSPATLKAYQWQMSTIEPTFRETSDIFDIEGMAKGLRMDLIKSLPKFQVTNNTISTDLESVCCSVCLQDYEEGDCVQKLPACNHLFHLNCIQSWLLGHSSCPICRKDV